MARFLFAVDSLKGTLSSSEAADLLTAAAIEAFPGCSCRSVAIADGGEGTVDAVLASVPGAGRRQASVTGPLGETVTAQWAFLPEAPHGPARAVIEMAQAAGLPLVAEQDRDPSRTTTRGVGELVREALDAGARDVTLAIGGSATNDGGLGLLAALGWRFLDSDGHELEPVGASLGSVATIDAAGADPRLGSTKITVMCDVTNPLCGPTGCAAVFAPQKGATPHQVRELDDAMASFAAVAAAHLGRDCSENPGAGAAGGLGFAAQTFLGAEFVLGIDALLDLCAFDDLAAQADLVVTGEGRLDSQTAAGKAVAGVARRAAAAGTPCVALCGCVESGAVDAVPGLSAAVSTVSAFTTFADHEPRSRAAFAEAAARLLTLLAIGAGLGAGREGSAS